MIDATRIRSGYAFLIFAMRGIHQSSVLSEMSSQFHDECSAVLGRFCIDKWPSSELRSELGLRAVDIDDRVQPDRLGDDAAPAGVEGAHDVRSRTRWAAPMTAGTGWESAAP